MPLPQLGHDLRAAGSMDRPVDPAAAGQGCVCCVADRVRRDHRDVALHEDEQASTELLLHLASAGTLLAGLADPRHSAPVGGAPAAAYSPRAKAMRHRCRRARRNFRAGPIPPILHPPVSVRVR